MFFRQIPSPQTTTSVFPPSTCLSPAGTFRELPVHPLRSVLRSGAEGAEDVVAAAVLHPAIMALGALEPGRDIGDIARGDGKNKG